ncbi:class D beta-lactamase [Lamprobacter modestohalophilus]|uniref:Class D beta-lactamase n=1 Tax=Lamprobacter modestohalophilus TaxID=1064514 RepID=A0A9X0WDE2_9GAMM|nr:class D beta-lactamase [Lamprobacter modestohalophilus]
MLIPVTPVQAEDAEIAALFAEAGVQGTLVLARLDGQAVILHNAARAEQRLPVASTFKIFNTLIALEEGAISGIDEVMPWDGRPHPYPDWNQDQTLNSAFAVSCVWCYQRLAERIGAERYRVHLAQADYGRLDEPFVTTEFWLDGSLTISAQEQVRFLRQVIERRLPYRPETYAGMRAIMLAEEGRDYRLFAKTGWAARATPQIGWYIGYVETADATWIFVLNMDIRDESELPLRQALSRASLQAKGIIAE